MKVIFLTHHSLQGHRFRVEQYFPYLNAYGVETIWQPIPKSLGKRLEIYRDLSCYDVIFIQRRLLSPIEFYHIRRKARKIIFDVDDAIMFRSSSSSRQKSLGRMWKFKYMVMNSDTVIVGNRFLKDQVIRYVDSNKVTLIPTTIDINFYPKKKEFSNKGRTILGWIGTQSTLKYLKDLDPIFESLAERFNQINLKIVCDEFYDFQTIPVIKKRWSLEEENDDLVSFDIGLMPLRNDLWSRGKCGLKIIQYQCVGLPVVCTPVGINRDIVRDGYNGFWATTSREWVEKLSILIEREDLRKEMGANGIRIVEREFNIEVTSEKLLSVFRGLSPH